MSSKLAKDQGNTRYQELLDKNHALETEVQDLKTRLEEAEELRRAISEGDLDALIIPGPQEKLIFTLDSADRAYRVLVETMNEGTVTLASDGTILYCNRRFAELIKMRSQAIVGTSIYGFIESEDEHTFKALLNQRTNAGEIKLRAKNGMSVPVYLSISSLHFEEPQSAWCLVVTDLTEQKKNEEIVSAGRLAQSIIEQAAEAIVVCDTDGKVTHFSNAVPRICKCNPALQKFEDIIDVRFSEGAKTGESFLPVSSALEGFSILGVETTFELKDGKKFHLLFNSGPLKNSDGRIIGCVVTLTDITERKRAEHRIRRYNRILEGTNQIFSSVVQAKTEEELGEACLSVALEVTRSEFGFIGEIGGDGLLHDIAVSDMGWEQCLMYDKNGHRRPPGDFVLHDLYGRVIDSGKGFFTNDPQSHPDSIGLPYGHPPLTSFLGVPLILDGKTMGMITVANCEGGYSSEQQEDLEAIASAVVQALNRKKKEQERERAEAMREAINSVNQTIHSTFNFDEIMKKAISEASRAIGCETAAISFREGRQWIARYVYGFPEDVIGAETNDEEESHAVLAIQTRKPVAISDAYNDERVNIDHMKKWGVRSVLVVPLIIRGKVIGVLFFNYHRSAFTFENSHLDFAAHLASSMSLALENSRLFESIKMELAERKMAEKALLESEKRFRLLSEANSILLLSKEPENVIQVIAGKVMQHLNCDVFFNYVFDDAQGRLHLNAYSGISEETAKEIEWLDKGSAICGCVARDGYRIVSRNVQHNEDKRADLARSMGIQAYSCQPLRIGETTIGTLSFGTRSRKDFKEDELALMSTVADQVSVAIERKRAENRLKETLDNLENIVKDRTAELEKAYDSLKESERGLAEAQKMAHLGNWDRCLTTNEVHWSDEVYRIFGFKPQEFDVTYSTYLSRVHPDDQDRVIKAAKQALERKLSRIDYRIVLNNGEERVVYEEIEVVFDEKNNPVQLKGIIQDITERKKAEEALEKIDKFRIKEIHHRIKNNLQVICSLLNLEAERFSDEKMLEALKESQNRVASMALIHEELYKGDKNDTLDFAAYLRKLTADLFSSYNIGNDNISLKMDLEQVYLDMDTAIPLGIIVNELVSNSLKHAFPAGSEGEIRISLNRTETFAAKDVVSGQNQNCQERNSFQYILSVVDNGKGIPEEIEFQDVDSLGLQLVNILVEQIDGCVDLKRSCGTDFTIWFGNKEQ